MTNTWPDSSDFWVRKRVVVTGGAGFLGSCVVRELCRRGASEVFIPRSRDYNLTTVEAVGRLYRDAHPHVVIHLAARVGGIGANRANPGKFFYENLVMGALLMEYARRHEVALPQRQVLGHPVGGEQNAGKLPR